MRLSLALFLTALLAGCGFLQDKGDETKGMSASQIYSEAKSELADGNYQRAIKLYEALEARYPYGRYAQQAQLEAAYAHYKDNEPAQAVAGADRFIKLHPNHPNVDYAYYLKGLANFNDRTGLVEQLGEYVGSQDLSERDPKAARESFEAFKDLVTRFPNSKYAPDASARMRYLVNALAMHEVHVARYYAARGAYLAAVNRAQVVLQQYRESPAQEEALAIMVRGYDRMGMPELRDDSLRVLRQNYPQSPFLGGGQQAKSWWKVW